MEFANKLQMDFSNVDPKGTVLFYFVEKYLKNFFVLLSLPSKEKNPSKNCNSYNKGQNLACNGLLESPCKFPPTKDVSKFPPRNWNQSSLHRPPKSHIWNLCGMYRLSSISILGV